MPEKAAPPLANLQNSQPDKTKAEEVAIALVPKSKKLLDQVSEALRIKHYAYRTEKTYIGGRLAVKSPVDR